MGAHHHDAAHGRRSPRRALELALGLTAAFMLVEAWVGWWSRSLALLADASHMLADTGALGLALVAQAFADRPRTSRSTYGLKRAEVLAAFLNGILLAAAAVLIVKEAAERWFSPVPVHGEAMMLTAGAGLMVNGLVAFLLMTSQRSNLNIKAALAHVLSDALGSVGALLAGALVVFFGSVRADPILSALIALLVALSGWRVLRETTGILLETAPAHLDVAAIERAILETSGVRGVHDLHVWCISERFDALTAHVVLERGAHGTDVCRAVSARLAEDFGLHHVTIQPEAPPPDVLVAVRSSRDGARLG